MSELPKGWAFTTIGDVCLKPEQKTPDAKASFKYIDISCIDRVQKRICEPETISGHDAPSRARKIVNTGDVLVSMTRPNLNAVALVPRELDKQIASTGFDVLKPLIVEPRWLFAVVRSKKFIDTISGETIGALYPACKADDIRNYEIPLPPQAEQTRIVEKLNEVLAQVDTIKARLDGIPAILKRFRQSVLAAAVSGRLTAEWRGGTSPNWNDVKLKDFVQAIEAGKNLKCIEVPPVGNVHGIIKISAVTWGIYDEEQSKTLPNNDLFIESRRIKVGDFLISRANTIELLGNPVIVHQVTKNLMLSDKVLRLVMEENDKPWVSIFLRSGKGRKEIESRSTGNQMSMRNIGQKALLDIDLPKCSKDEQKEIVRLVDQYFAFADTIESQVKKAQARADNLTQSILAKAFRGELVAQDPNDEPAEKLLERIAQARKEAEALAKAAKKVAKTK